MKKLKLRKTSPKRLLYLVAIVIICSLGLLCSNARIEMYKAFKVAHKKFLSTHLKQDTETAQYYFYANYRLNTDYIARVNNTGSNATFINVCQAQCNLFKGRELLKACEDLSSEYKFKQYRVYTCSLKITLENNQPLKCEAINNQIFNLLCDNFIASL